MKKKYTYVFLAVMTALCVGCSTKAPVPEPTIEPLPRNEAEFLKGANVRDVAVLYTEESRGGAGERKTEWADYLFDDYHRGMGKPGEAKRPLPPPPPPPPGAEPKKDHPLQGKDQAKDHAKDKSIYAKDKSIYSKDRSIYSKDRSIYAKPMGKKHLGKNPPPPPPKAVAPMPPKKVAPPPKVAPKPVAKVPQKVEAKKPKTVQKPKLMKTPNLKAVQTTTVDGKKVSPTITELKDVPVNKNLKK